MKMNCCLLQEITSYDNAKTQNLASMKSPFISNLLGVHFSYLYGALAPLLVLDLVSGLKLLPE